MVNTRGTSEENRARIQRELLDHVKRFGLQRTRLVAVAEDLGMSHANIYRYFKNKNEIIDSIAVEWLQEAEDMVTARISEGDAALDLLVQMLTTLNAHLHQKLKQEPAAEQIFFHVFTHHPDELAAHLTSMKMRVGELVMRHEAAFANGQRAQQILDVMTVVLEPFVNPLMMGGRQADDDRPRLEILIRRLLSA